MALKRVKRPKYFECCPQQDRLYFGEVWLERSPRRGFHTISGIGMAVLWVKKPQQVTDVRIVRRKNSIFYVIDIHFQVLPIRKGMWLLAACGILSLLYVSVALPTHTTISQHCEDRFQNCTYLALTGACAKYSVWMRLHCGVSCNSCQGKAKLPCEDQHKYCSYWAYAGACKTHAAYMLVNCKYSCNLCGGEECQDQDEKCPSLARKGECLKDSENMLVRCRKSCFMCGGNSTACQDKDAHCTYLAHTGYCRSRQSFMMKFCQKSCTRCEGCFDRNKFCPAWAKKGECEKNPGYMKFYCQRSCKICQGTPEA